MVEIIGREQVVGHLLRIGQFGNPARNLPVRQCRCDGSECCHCSDFMSKAVLSSHPTVRWRTAPARGPFRGLAGMVEARRPSSTGPRFAYVGLGVTGVNAYSAIGQF